MDERSGVFSVKAQRAARALVAVDGWMLPLALCLIATVLAVWAAHNYAVEIRP